MQLPKLDVPLFDLVYPSKQKKVTARPFLVKEEKILLMAQQSGEEKDMVTALKQVINNCVQDPNFNADDLTVFDLEYMFVKLRARSINNIIEVTYRDSEDNKEYSFEIDLDKLELREEKKMDRKIQLDDKIGVIMNAPSITVIENAPADLGVAELVDYLVRSCIEQVYDENNTYIVKDFTDEDMDAFIDSMNIEAYEKIRAFFDGLPSLYHKIEFENSMGTKRVVELTTLSDFFMWG